MKEAKNALSYRLLRIFHALSTNELPVIGYPWYALWVRQGANIASRSEGCVLLGFTHVTNSLATVTIRHLGVPQG